LICLLFLVGCYKEHTFGDCELACTDALGCPSGLSCVDGMCRASGASSACHTSGTDAPVDVMLSGIDADGDGVDDAIDNCLGMNNPEQYNEDGDAKGDMCDPCPIGPSVQDDLDHDGDGVGNACDPFDDTVNHDRILVFEAFNGAVSASATRFGDGADTFNNGTIKVSPGNMFSGYAWMVPDTAQVMVATRVSIGGSGSGQYYVGTVDRVDPTSGSSGGACANRFDPALGIRDFAFVNTTDGSAPSSGRVSDSDFLENAPYTIREQRVNGTERCNRDDVSGTGFGSIASGASYTGIGTNGRPATFDYVLIVGH
jgi:hypothetical protein